jgi:hypothetical protein
VISEVAPAEGCVDFRSSVCDHGRFFADVAAAEPWRREHSTGQIWPIGEAFAIMGTRLRAEGHAKTASNS